MGMRVVVGLASGLLALSLIEAFRPPDNAWYDGFWGIVAALVGGRRPAARSRPGDRRPRRARFPLALRPAIDGNPRAAPRGCAARCPRVGLPDEGDSVGERVAMISLHTSPLDQPGTGDAGGMNVYVIELSKRLAAQGIAVDVFTRATSSSLPQVVEAADGVLVRHIAAGPVRGAHQGRAPRPAVHLRPRGAAHRGPAAARPLRRRPLPLLALRPGRRAGARPLERPAGALDAHHGQGQERRARRRATPPSPLARVIGEEQVVEAADLLVANTDTEAQQLVDLYDASPGRGRGDPPRRRPGGLRPPRPRRARRRARPAPRRRGADVRRADPAAQGARRAAARGGACCSTQDPSLRSPARRACRRRPVRLRPRRTRRRSPTSPPSSASPTSCASCRRSPRRELAVWCVRGHRGRRAVLQRVVRPGGRRGPGHRHAGRRGRRRRPHHRRARRRQRAAGRHPRAPRLGCRAAPADRRPGAGRAARAGARSRTRRSSRGSAPPSAPSTPTSGRPDARSAGLVMAA